LLGAFFGAWRQWNWLGLDLGDLTAAAAILLPWLFVLVEGGEGNGTEREE